MSKFKCENDGECDYLWDGHEQLRESSPTYQIGKSLFRKYSKRLYGDVLDIGCGVELWQKSVLANNGNIKSYLGVDSSELVIKKLNINREQPSSRFKFKKGDANNLQIDGMFDCILIWGVIEHVEQDRKLLLWVAEHLKQDGLLFMDFPLRPKAWSVMDEQTHHFRRYKRNEVWELLRPFAIMDYYFVETFFLKAYRHFTKNRKDRITISKDDNKVRLLRKVTPLMLGIDGMFSKIGLWGNAVVILARKE